MVNYKEDLAFVVLGRELKDKLRKFCYIKRCGQSDTIRKALEFYFKTPEGRVE